MRTAPRGFRKIGQAGIGGHCAADLFNPSAKEQLSESFDRGITIKDEQPKSFKDKRLEPWLQIFRARLFIGASRVSMPIADGSRRSTNPIFLQTCTFW
jgi:hypothetical protein